GMDLIGTKAPDTNESATTISVNRAWAAWALPTRSPTLMNSQLKAWTTARMTAKATITAARSAWVRKPMAKRSRAGTANEGLDIAEALGEASSLDNRGHHAPSARRSAPRNARTNSTHFGAPEAPGRFRMALDLRILSALWVSLPQGRLSAGRTAGAPGRSSE